MEKFYLTKPSMEWEDQILNFKRAFQDEHLNGGQHLDRIDSISDWLEHIEASSFDDTCQEGRSPSSTFLCIQERDQEMVGICNIRHDLNQDFLINYAGHIGYSIKPNQRKKGYATEQLRLALLEAQKLGIDRVLVTAAEWNIPSQKTILSNGGVYEDSRCDATEQEMMLRYWISN
ncbi:GNAT family N-acetyltransferase [Streptococcus rifensis]